MASPRRRPAARRAAALVVAALLGATSAGAVGLPRLLGKRSQAYERGQEVVVTGVVTDAEGRPVPGLVVRLEGWRSEFSVRKMGRVRREPARIAAESGAQGEYRLEWPWHEFYNRFELALGQMVREPGGERFELLERVDLTEAILHGSPVVQSLTLTDRSPVDAYRELLAGIESDEQRRLFQELGRPERVDRRELGDRIEVTWWYFRAGKAYRFEDGRLQQVVPFEPVTPF